MITEHYLNIREHRLILIKDLALDLFGSRSKCIIEQTLDENEDWIQHMKLVCSPHGYHDLNHIFAMTLNADKIANYFFCTLAERQIIFCACIHHDFGHSFGQQPDSINVARAISIYEQSCMVGMFSKDEHEIIADCIFCTVFPFRVHPKNIYERVVRIADLTMCYEPDAKDFALGLEQEFNNKGITQPVTVPDMINFTESSDFRDIILDLIAAGVLKRDQND